ncbi:hypothetical protein GGI26_004666 [Coemansia sp. RSA 1358]|uniref:Uncharacterized protein n=1 Tax=Coemansia umbellata TaxID=1424467 RepID=A0ABQ8PJF0_9FUNG|nr:hypothetical protein EDC05_004005 [Coemansia umbellata]KAJ2620771.1 hypothetical protein GGI26_004666 [Coemansia sp. RSA 1358]
MDKIGEFIVGLQTILDSPNPPRDDLVRVMQSTQREFLFSALSLSTLTWPTRTHLELVKIIISMPVPEPSPEVVMQDPTISHEADPFFASEYFDKLRTQLLSIPIQQLAESDGSWVRNIGFSIEATIMQACRRADALEKLEELTKTDDGKSGQDFSRIRMYCAQILGSGILELRHWEAIARIVFTMFHVLPFSSKTLARQSQSKDEQENTFLHPFMPRLVTHYSHWLQIVVQMIDNHGQTLCRRMPTVIEDSATKQFKWGIPSLHAVATTELLRNFVMRRIMLHYSAPLAGSSSSGNNGESVVPWATNTELIAAEEQRLEQLEQTILSKIIAKDASAVYGMMSEHHHLLQMFGEYTKNLERLDVVPGTIECLSHSLTHTCYGLAPILGFEEQALTQAMDMRKLFECLSGMKATSLRVCYAPLYGCYPQNTSTVPAYAELLLLRMSTTLFNIDEPWGEIAKLLAPGKIPAIPQSLAVQLARSLRLVAMYFDVFSLNTTIPNGSLPLPQQTPVFDSVARRIMTYQFIQRPYADDISHLLFEDVSAPVSAPESSEAIAMGIGWACDFVTFAREFMSPQLLFTQLAATFERALAFYTTSGRMSVLIDAMSKVEFNQWHDLASVHFKKPIHHLNCQSASLMAMVWSCAQRLFDSGRLKTDNIDTLDRNRWQQTLALCCPESAILAYIIMVQCTTAAQQLVRTDSDSSDGNNNKYAIALNQKGIDALHALERTLTINGVQEWSTRGLLFVPQMYSGNNGDSKPIERFAQSQFAGAVKILSHSTHAEWRELLGLQNSSLPFSEDDMRRVANLITHYADNAPSLFTLLPNLLSGMPGTTDSQELQPLANPFEVPNITSKLAPIESQFNPNACDVKAAVRQWQRNVANLPFSQSRKHIQELIAECYPSSFKHYLENVILQFMEVEPVIGVELVIGSIADHMFKNQIVYSRKASPFYAIRNMFAPISAPPSTMSLSAKHESADIYIKKPAMPKSEPVFNAVVGGKVRQYAHARNSAIAQQQVPTTAERGSPVDDLAKVQSGLYGTTRANKNSSMPGTSNEGLETVQAPTACHRILLLLTALRYGNSFRDTPIHIWLTDCLDLAPQRVLERYFDTLLEKDAPNFGNDLPLEPNWPRKVFASMSLWAKDQSLITRPLVHIAGASVMKHVLENCGEQWSDRWAKWAPVVSGGVASIFSKPTTSVLQDSIVQAMLSVPLASENRDAVHGQLSALQKHPLFILADVLTPRAEMDKIAFADNCDWFLVHILPRLVESLTDNPSARNILGAVLSSPECLYQIVPWFDIATTLVQNVPLNHGCPVAMNSAIAKKNFVAYLSPLARILFAISSHIDGEGDGALGYTGNEVEEEDIEETGLSAKSKVTESSAVPDSPFSASNRDDGIEDEGEFSWHWIDEWLVLYLSSSSSRSNASDSVDDLSDTIDALLDVYTYSSMRGLRRSIENVVTASCLHDQDILQAVLYRLFSKRPLDTFTLHSLRPKRISHSSTIPRSAAENDMSFRPGAEVYPLAQRVLQLALGASNANDSVAAARKVTKLIEDCMWSISEEPDVRRNLIALKPRLIPKEQRPAATEKHTSQETIIQTTSGHLHIPTEAIASGAAYALDRSVYLLGVLLTSDDARTKDLAVHLSHSRVFLAALMVTIGDSMRQFPTLSTTRELLNTLWSASDGGEAILDGIKTSQIWLGVNFFTLAQRLNSQTPEEYVTWSCVHNISTR